MTDLATFTPDCSRCAALCCTALPYTASADFPESKPAGTPCRNLRSDLTCAVHAELRDRGWVGCTVFECFGAGQHLTQHTFGGLTWRDDPTVATAMFSAFDALRLVQEIRYYLALLAAHPLPPPLSKQVKNLAARADDLSQAPADRLTADAAGALQQQAGPLFEDASRYLRRQVRAARPARSRLRAHCDLAGADLRGEHLAGADLRGALLIGADLRGNTLNLTDLLGADLRDARLHGADVREALFLTQTQLNAARGDASTTVPRHLRRPRHWSDS